LDHLQFYVTQEKGTERPFFNEYLSEKRPGIFNCIVCDQQLFDSKSKFDSGSGWPSFYDVVSSEQVKLIEDSSYGNTTHIIFSTNDRINGKYCNIKGMKRIEVVCSGCGSHLGHLFNDG
jgi:peptide-methionine (R)-S-oxide reductase